jgi:hypothetical protein
MPPFTGCRRAGSFESFPPLVMRTIDWCCYHRTPSRSCATAHPHPNINASPPTCAATARMLNWRPLAGYTAALALGAVFIILLSQYFPIGTLLTSARDWIMADPTQVSHEMTTHILAVSLLAIAAANFRTVRSVVRRFRDRTDRQIVGKWYIYRYTQKHGEAEPLDDIWYIRRTIFNQYRFRNVKSTLDETHGRYSITGEVVFNEFGRLNLLMEICCNFHRM